MIAKHCPTKNTIAIAAQLISKEILSWIYSLQSFFLLNISMHMQPLHMTNIYMHSIYLKSAIAALEVVHGYTYYKSQLLW